MKNRVKNIFTNSVNFEKLEIEQQEKLLEEFNIYIHEAGWQDWMNNYIENEELTEIEEEQIEIKQAEIFLKIKFN